MSVDNCFVLITQCYLIRNEKKRWLSCWQKFDMIIIMSIYDSTSTFIYECWCWVNIVDSCFVLCDMTWLIFMSYHWQWWIIITPYHPQKHLSTQMATAMLILTIIVGLFDCDLCISHWLLLSYIVIYWFYCDQCSNRFSSFLAFIDHTQKSPSLGIK